MATGKIVSVYFNPTTPIHLGPMVESTVFLSPGKICSGYRISMNLNQQEKVLEIVGTHIDRPEEKFLQWVPYQCISSILFENPTVPAPTPAPSPEQKPSTVKKK